MIEAFKTSFEDTKQMNHRNLSIKKIMTFSLNESPTKCNIKHTGRGLSPLSDCIRTCKPFNVTKGKYPTKTANLYGLWVAAQDTVIYAVYSYGVHFPVAIYSESDNKWYVNSETESVTTSAHITKVKEALKPFEFELLSCENMKNVHYWGTLKR